MKHRLLFTLIGLILFPVAMMAAQTSGTQSGSHNVSANQEFKILVYENSDSTILTFDGEEGTRGILGDAWKTILGSYRNTMTGQIANTSAALLSTAVNAFVELVRSKRTDWYDQARRDCMFTKRLPMNTEITDFYATTSTRGAMDLDNIVFDGFGCQQYLTFRDQASGETCRELVLDMKCSLRKDTVGLDRIRHHSKFEVVPEYVFFRPDICNLPNDSLSEQQIYLREPFSFANRRNLRLNIDVDLTSSWMNEAIQVAKDQLLGQFNISVSVPDSTALQNNGWLDGSFIYINPTDDNVRRYRLTPEQTAMMRERGRLVKVTGESFLVPRSFVGYDGGDERIWGTGQYKVNMTISESCDVNLPYYQVIDSTPQGPSRGREEGMGPAQVSGGKVKWNNRWKPEWNKMKKRRRRRNPFAALIDDLKMQYGGYRWIYTITDPVCNVILDVEKTQMKALTDKWLNLTDGAVAVPKTAQTGQNSQPGQSGQSGQGPQTGQGGQSSQNPGGTQGDPGGKSANN